MMMEADLLEQIVSPPALHSAVLPAAGIRTCADDFQVEELPAYHPDGSGEHLFLWIQKRGIAAGELISRIASTLQIRGGDIGVAGQKDRHAVTRQFVSVPRHCESRLGLLSGAEIQILAVSAHRHKLRTGHLRGNRFCIGLRRSDAMWTIDHLQAAATRLHLLVTDGFPSYFGPQRFGHGGSTLLDGLELLGGRLSRRRWPMSQQRFMTRMVLSAVQSAVFNLVVSERVRCGTIRQPLPGDVVIRQYGSRPFLLPPAAAAEQEPADIDQLPVADARGSVNAQPAWLIPAGPMPGSRMPEAAGSIHQMEQQMLRLLGLTGEEFQRFTKLCSGTRRSMLEFPAAVSAQLASPSTPQVPMDELSAAVLSVSFELRSGVYATVLLRELCASLHDAAGSADPKSF